MKAFLNRLCFRCAAAILLVLLNVVPGLAQEAPIPCSAFARNAHGGWKVLAPVMLGIDGRVVGPMVGITRSSGLSRCRECETAKYTAMPAAKISQERTSDATRPGLAWISKKPADINP